MKKKAKKKDLNKLIKVLTALCAVAAVCLVGMVTVYISGDNGSVAFVSGEDGPSGTGTTPTATENSTTAAPSASVSETTAPTTEKTTSVQTTSPVTTESSTIVTTTKIPDLPAASDRIIVNPNQELWNLVVVNSGREMPEGFVPKLETVAGTDVRMDYRVAPWYNKMYDAAKKDGIILVPYSGYRSYERQKINYNNLTEKYMNRYNISREEAAAKAATVILPPGTSEHNLGLAMDICNTYDSFANQKEYKWLMQHAHEYGFILRYTAEKQHITGIVPEPWHWRYVGVEYAEKIKNSGLCLEEYLDSIGVAY